MKSKGCHDVEMDSQHSGQGVGPLFSKQEIVVLPSGCGGTRVTSWVSKWIEYACRPSIRAKMMTYALSLQREIASGPWNICQVFGATLEPVGHGGPGASSSSKMMEHEQSMSVVGDP